MNMKHTATHIFRKMLPTLLLLMLLILSAHQTVFAAKPVPSTPTKITGTSTGAGKLRITWKKSKCPTGYQIAGYEIKITKPSIKFTYTKTITNPKVVRFTLMGMRQKTKYNFSIRSFMEVKGKRVYSRFAPRCTVWIK